MRSGKQRALPVLLLRSTETLCTFWSLQKWIHPEFPVRPSGLRNDTPVGLSWTIFAPLGAVSTSGVHRDKPDAAESSGNRGQMGRFRLLLQNEHPEPIGMG